ncbi:exosortase-dependent surface protein XDP1 [Alteromonas stellipolaris]|uniref:exosortase-dependent surface protein XDP1 n=1 Tax=Alteromonas stellipolaris TaxID=233316 RepID=UPI002733E345|nr:exosortase-dependent surface protein XDP1 [Alteromonas stellipolaris]MDP2594277.1 exosortase-dependent surface protein XDP1 [Alteromonas stellipolaris]
MPYLRKILISLTVLSTLSAPVFAGGSRGDRDSGKSSPVDSSLAEGYYDLTDFDESVVTSSTGVTIGGVNITLTGWSDTGNSLDPEDFDNIVKTASPYEVSSFYGYGVLNQDGEGSTSPDHSIDNYYWNGENSSAGIAYADFDFVLFSFDSDVTLDSIDFGWANNNGSDQQVSIAALNNSQLGLLEGASSTWSEIIAGAVSSSFNITKTGSYSYTTGELELVNSAKYWLVGAYNTVFGAVDGASMYNDGFKITSIDFTEGTPPPVAEVHEPGVFGLMLMSFAILVWRRNRAA